jgi:guanylate kinase
MGRGRWTGTGLLVVISAPSGGGKTTVINSLRRRRSEFLYSISVTTRPKRPGERNGVHYYFASAEEFERMKKAGELVEWATVHGKSYGTPRANIDRAFRQKRIMLFDLDVQGAAAVRQALPGVVSIFLLPPSMTALVRRLKGRRSDDKAAIARRIETARTELARADEYDYLVMNDDLDLCVSDCEAIIRAELLRREHHLSQAVADSRT